MIFFIKVSFFVFLYFSFLFSAKVQIMDEGGGTDGDYLEFVSVYTFLCCKLERKYFTFMIKG